MAKVDVAMLEVDSPYPVAQYDSGRPTTLRGRGFHTAYSWWGPLVVLANAAIIIWLWVHDGQVTGIHNTAGMFQSLGRITGLLGAYLLLIQLLFFARLPWFVRHVGLDRLVAQSPLTMSRDSEQWYASCIVSAESSN